MLVMSNLYSLHHGSMVMSPKVWQKFEAKEYYPKERHQSLRNYPLANQVKYYSTTLNRLNCCSPENVPINATCKAGHKALPDRGPVPQEVKQHWQVTEVDCRFLLGSKHGIFRFGSIPDLIELDHLTVSGDVTFGRGVSQFLNICRNNFFASITTYWFQICQQNQTDVPTISGTKKSPHDKTGSN